MFIKPKLAIQDFDYELPDAQIAYHPAPDRAGSKLLIWDQAIIDETKYAQIANHIPSNATLLFNNSKVIAARILFDKPAPIATTIEKNTISENTKSKIEIFCLEPTEAYTPVILAMQATRKVSWNCLVGGAKKWKEDELIKEIIINDELIHFHARKIKQSEGKFLIEFTWDHPKLNFSEILTAIGNIPLPPYIQRNANEEDKDRYQTTYAIEEGSVAAPTAGLHFNEAVFSALNQKNIHQRYLTLHVGAGTFMPVKADTIDEHTMHAEFIEVDASLIQYLLDNDAHKKGPIIAVGTTSLRTIESVYWLGVKIHAANTTNHLTIDPTQLILEQWEAYELAEKKVAVMEALQSLLSWMQTHKLNKLIAKTQLMVTPGYSFKICDALVTNFHQPKSTLLLIIAAITGENWKKIYQHALNNQYRFLSYGDGCLFWIKSKD